MNNIYEILKEFNENNSTNYKLDLLKKYKDNELLKRILKMTYDNVAFTYGVSIKNARKHGIQTEDLSFAGLTLESALDYLENFLSTRKHTGHKALEYVNFYLNNLSSESSEVLEKILDRDLKINIGKTQINKVHKGLLIKPAYMRCDVYSSKTAKNISFPGIVQKKADGTYREFTVDSDKISSRSRSGEDYEYPIIFDSLRSCNDGVYVGELTVELNDQLLSEILPDLEKSDKKNGTNDVEMITSEYNKHKNENKKYTLPRSIGNGLINSSKPPHNNIILELWDYITLEEYNTALLRDKKITCTKKYSSRWEELNSNVNEKNNIRIIEHKLVNNLKEALEKTTEWMNAGYEGSILKDWNGVFKDGTSKQQLKLKLEIDCEMRITGFIEGKKGTKREETFGSITFGNDDGTIKGSTSGFTDLQLEDFNSRRDEMIGKIITVQFNDLSKARGSETYALSHPRFIELRNDKTETDSLETVLKLRDMAMELS